MPPVSCEMALQDFTLHFKLSGVGDVLPLATSTLAEVGARGLDAVGGGVDHVGENYRFGALLTFNNLDFYGLSGDG